MFFVLFVFCVYATFGGSWAEAPETSYEPPAAPVYPPNAPEPTYVAPEHHAPPVYPPPVYSPPEDQVPVFSPPVVHAPVYTAPVASHSFAAPVPLAYPTHEFVPPVFFPLHHKLTDLVKAKVHAALAVKPKIVAFVLDKAANILKFKSHVLAG